MLADQVRTPVMAEDAPPADHSMSILQYGVAIVAVIAAALLAIN